MAAGLRAILIVRWPHFAYEDALITFRYAENLAHGLGFVYNPGEHVLGTTAPLYGVLLASLRYLGLDMFVWAAVFNLLCDLGFIYIATYKLIDNRPDSAAYAAALGAGLLLSAYFPFLRATISRMETSLFLLLLALVLWYSQERCYIKLGIVLALLPTVRVDGLSIAGVVLLWLFWKERRGFWITSSVMAVALLPYLGVTTLYYGSPIPQSAIAKAYIYPHVFSSQRSRWESLLRLIQYIFAGNFFHRLLLLPPAIMGAHWLLRFRGLWPRILLVWFSLYLLVLGFSNTFIHEWYLVPLLAVYTLFAGAGVGVSTRRVLSFLTVRRIRIAIAGGIFFLCFVLPSVWVTIQKTDRQYAFELASRQRIGVWLRQQGDGKTSVLLEPIGYIGYYSGAKVYDAMGLVTPQALTFFTRWGLNDYMLAWALDAQPEFVVLRGHEVNRASPRCMTAFLQRYALVQRITAHSDIVRRDITFFIFHRFSFARQHSRRGQVLSCPPK